MVYDRYFKQSLKQLFRGMRISGYSIGPLEKQSDLILIPSAEITHAKYIPALFKDEDKRFVVEFKSENDQYSEKAFLKLAMYKYGYCFNENMDLGASTRVCSCLIVANPNRSIENLKEEGKILAQEMEGIYTITPPVIDYLIIADELAYVPENFALLLHVSKEKYEDLLDFILEQKLEQKHELTELIAWKYFLMKGKGGKTLMAKAERIFKDLPVENIQNALNLIGEERIIETMGHKKAIEVMGYKKAIEVMGIETVFQNVDADDLNEETIQLLVKLLKKKVGLDGFRKLVEKMD